MKMTKTCLRKLSESEYNWPQDPNFPLGLSPKCCLTKKELLCNYNYCNKFIVMSKYPVSKKEKVSSSVIKTG